MKKLDYSLNAYDYELPEGLIAQNPVVPRDRSRLLVVDSTTEQRHCIFRDLPDLLQPGDLLVLNHTRVISARLYGRKVTGAEVEILLLEEREHNCWLALVKPGKRFNLGARLEFEPLEGGVFKIDTNLMPEKLTATVVATDEETGGRLLQFDLPVGVFLLQVLDRFGVMPLPPYVTQSEAQPEQYQTVYAEKPGAVAAPTAGLHFTDELLDRLQEKGIDRAFVTLHVGVGTFRPVEVEEITTHRMHSEWLEVSAATVDKISQTKARGGRVIAVGTTVVRALEGAAASSASAGSDRELLPFSGYTDLFIYPGFQWRVVEGLITNFHLPRSSLLMLVSAAIGRERLLEVYREAIALRYRFYSFGDAMLILPSAWMG